MPNAGLSARRSTQPARTSAPVQPAPAIARTATNAAHSAASQKAETGTGTGCSGG